MKVLKFIFNCMLGIGLLGYFALMVMTEFGLLIKNWLQIFNPFFHLKVFLYLFENPLTYICLASAVIGHFASLGVNKTIEDERRKYY